MTVVAAPYYSGPDGVFYDPKADEIIVLKKGEMAMTYDQVRNRCVTYDRYHVWCNSPDGFVDGKLLVVTMEKYILRLNKFE